MSEQPLLCLSDGRKEQCKDEKTPSGGGHAQPFVE
jgi:hypothetical protein